MISTQLDRFSNSYRLELEYEAIPSELDGLTILHVSDFHYKKNYRKQKLLTFAGVHEKKYDIAFLTGDIIDTGNERLDSDAVDFFRKIKADLKIWIPGNHERKYNRDIAPVTEKLKEAGFALLMNSSVRFVKNKKTVNIVGIDDWQYGKPDYGMAFSHIDKTAFTIAGVHSFDRIVKDYPANLWLSGHNHAGEFSRVGIFILYLRNQYKDPYHQVAGLYSMGKDSYSFVHPGMRSHSETLGFPRIGAMRQGTVEITLRKKK